jgi:hypothetical protein
MDQLRAQAEATGGTMLSHLGNHEWMNAIGMYNAQALHLTSLTVGPVTGDWRYIYSPSNI